MGAPVDVWRPGTTQKVSVVTSSVAVTNPFGGQTYVVRIVSATACHYRIGGSPVAVITDSLLPANVIEYIRVNPGEKIAFIRVTGDGTAIVTEVT